jgi:nuclear pore complex protein Nup155
VNDKISSIVELNRDRAGNSIKEIAQQFSEPPRQFMLMANLCVYFYQKLRPVDTLYDILERSRGLQKEAALSQAFFDRYGKTESCAMCLSVYCSIDNDVIKNRAKNLFFDYGGAPSAAFASQITGNHLGRVVGPTGIHYSGKHDGLILYFARIVSPVWKLKMFANR